MYWRLNHLLLLLMLVFSCQSQTKSKDYLLDAAKFEKQQLEEKGQLVDVRTPSEFEEGHLKGARNIDFLQDDFKDNTAKLDKNKAVYVYCKSGGRSAKAVEVLRQQGFTKIYELDGGYNAWKKK